MSILLLFIIIATVTPQGGLEVHVANVPCLVERFAEGFYTCSSKALLVSNYSCIVAEIKLTVMLVEYNQQLKVLL